MYWVVGRIMCRDALCLAYTDALVQQGYVMLMHSHVALCGFLGVQRGVQPCPCRLQHWQPGHQATQMK